MRLVVAQLGDKGTRVDIFLADKLPELSRARIQTLIKNEKITVEGNPIRVSYKLKGNEGFDIVIPEPNPSKLEPEDIKLDVLYEDDDIIVVNKSAGLVVHPGAGNHSGTLVNALLYRYPNLHIGDETRPGIVHRLDKETSGVMVVARNDVAHKSLTESFKARQVSKIYLAFCVGGFKVHEFDLKTGHERHPTDRKRFTTKSDGKLAHSHFKVLATDHGISLLEVTLHTGRTHQIRAQLADIGRPILMDVLYGGKKAVERLKESPVKKLIFSLNRHALHAYSLGFVHPTLNKVVSFKAPLPDDLQELNDMLFHSVIPA